MLRSSWTAMVDGLKGAAFPASRAIELELRPLGE